MRRYVADAELFARQMTQIKAAIDETALLAHRVLPDDDHLMGPLLVTQIDTLTRLRADAARLQMHASLLARVAQDARVVEHWIEWPSCDRVAFLLAESSQAQ